MGSKEVGLVGSCEHAPRAVRWPGGEAFLTANGNWWGVTAPGLAESLTKCPGCGTPLWGLPPSRTVLLEAQAHAENRRVAA